MGWTWRYIGNILQLYPSLADSPVLLEQWPGFGQAVAEMRASGLLPASAEDAATGEKAKAPSTKKKNR